jgi:hypothetical protein
LLTPLRSESCNDDWIPRERASSLTRQRTALRQSSTLRSSSASL